MTEIFQIFCQVLVIFIFCYFPQYYLNFFNVKRQSIIEKISLGLTINIFILLLISFINQKNLDLIFIILAIIFFNNLFFFVTENLRSKLFDARLIFLFIFVLIFSFDLANNLKLGWDVQNFWILKTLNFIEGGDIYNLKNIPRPEYPHLGSFIWAIYTKISFLEYEYLGRIFYIFLFCVSIFSVAELLNSNDIVKILFSSIVIILIYDVLLFNGYQEILLFSIFALFSKYFYMIIKNNISKNFINFYIVIIFLLLSSSIWIKNEAIFFSLTSIILILYLPKRTSLFKLSLFSAFVLVIALRFFIFKEIGMDASLMHHNYSLNLSNFGSYFLLDRVFLIIKYLFFGLTSNLLYIITIFIMLFIYFSRKNNVDLSIYSVSLIINLSLVFSFYFFTDLPIERHLKYSIERVLFDILGIYLIPIIIFLNIYSKKLRIL